MSSPGSIVPVVQPTEETVPCPFPGLHYFTEEQAHLFFGREGQSDELVRKLARRRFLSVVGSSGVGKSSLIRAGLFSGLLSGNMAEAGARWRFVEMRPMADPIGRLSAALAMGGLSAEAAELRTNTRAIAEAFQRARNAGTIEDGTNLLILADQFEELFRYEGRNKDPMANRDEKAAFVRALMEAFRQRDFPIYVAFAMRSEFLGDCARFRDLPEEMNESQYLVPRLTREQRRSAIEGPFAIGGTKATARLVQRVLNDTGDEPDELPVMQHALMRTWTHWVNKTTPHLPALRTDQPDVKDYEDIGTIEHALSRHADDAMKEVSRTLGARGEELVKRVFLLLGTRDDRGRETRRPADVSEMMGVSEASLKEVETVLDAYKDSFLTLSNSNISPETTVDVIHESLLRRWTRLKKEWAVEERDSESIYVQLARRAAANPKDYLRGPVLRTTSKWWKTRKPNGTWAKRYHPGFEEARKLLKASERRSIAIGVVTAVAALLIISLVIQLSLARRITVQLLAAKAALTFSDSESLIETSALLAATSLRISPNIDAQIALSRALALLPKALLPLKHPGATLVAYSPDGKILASGAPDGSIQLWRTSDGEWIQNVSAPTGLRGLQWAGEAIAIANGTESDGKLTLLSGPMYTMKRDFPCPRLSALSVDPRGLAVAAVCDGKLQVWQSRSWSDLGNRIGDLRVGDKDGFSIVPRLVSVKVIDTESGKNGRLLDIAVAGSDSDNIEEGIVFVGVGEMPPNRQSLVVDAPITSLRFGPNGRHILFLQDDGNIKYWDPIFGDESSEFKLPDTGNTEGRATLSSGHAWPGISPDLVLSTQEGTGRLWNTSLESEIVRFIAPASIVGSAMSPDDTEVALALGRLGFLRWNIRSSDEFPLPLIISAGFDSGTTTLVARTTASGTLLQVPPATNRPPERNRNLLRLSQDGNSVLMRINQRSAGGRRSPDGLDLSYMLHRVRDGQVAEAIWKKPLGPFRVSLTTPVFSGDGKYLAGIARDSVNGDGTLYVWNVSEGNTLPKSFPLSEATTLLGFSTGRPQILARKSAEIWSYDALTGESTLLPIKGARGPGALSADGRFLAIAGPATDTSSTPTTTEDLNAPARVLRVWDLSTNQEKGVAAHPEAVRRVAFSPAGDFLLTASEDDSVRIWNWPDLIEVARLPELPYVLALGMTADRRIAIVTSSELVLRHFEPKGLLDQVCALLGRNLNDSEWRQYVPYASRNKACPNLP